MTIGIVVGGMGLSDPDGAEVRFMGSGQFESCQSGRKSEKTRPEVDYGTEVGWIMLDRMDRCRDG